MNRMKVAGIAFAIVCLSLMPIKGHGEEMQELKRIRCTCYCEPGTTRSGHQTHAGVIAGRKEDLGKVAALYAINTDGTIGDFIGYFDFYDTGSGADTDGDGKGDSILNGKSVDVWTPDLATAKKWVKTYGDYVFIKYIEADG